MINYTDILSKNNYNITRQDNYLIIKTENNIYKIKVNKDKSRNYIFKFNKKSITAKDGIDGLMEFLESSKSKAWMNVILINAIKRAEII